MNISNLTIREIDEKIRHYINDYFTGSTITNYEGKLFTENYTLQFDEIAVDLPQKHLFKDSDQINNAIVGQTAEMRYYAAVTLNLQKRGKHV